MDEPTKFEWHSGYRKVKRPGFWGPLLDLIAPRVEPTGFCGFTLETTEGKIYTSQDGVTWTMRDEQ